jgi:hypothetical protein
MFDYILGFPDETTAQQDSILNSYFLKDSLSMIGQWRGDCCFPGLTVWNDAQDITTQVTDQYGNISNNVVHTYYPLWRIAISLPTSDPNLDTHPALEICTNRDAATLGANLSNFVLYSNLPLAQLAGLHISPLPAGSGYSFT